METDSSCNHHLSFIDTLHGTWLQAESKALRYSGEERPGAERAVGSEEALSLFPLMGG